ncbi:MAG TPA: M24 family metallopeptidase, partial [Bacteroidota bacterium]|nr:M24 family metallopeptidase [Bacteroidota bacterium]
PEELDATRKAIDITLASIAATHAQLKEGLSEAEVAEILSSEMRKRGSRGDGLVQFGPDSALPHGGPGDHQLKAPCVVLIDAGCRVDGYISDISRTIYWGGESSAKFKQVFNVVLDAQQTAASIARSGVVCEEMDRAARNVIRKAGFGNYFTHRLGHGIGLDGHEYPYLVEGNGYKMKENQTFTIEPGIYLPGEFGVRIEDDFVITGNGVSQLSPRVDPL